MHLCQRHRNSLTGMLEFNQVLAFIAQLNSAGCDDSTETWDPSWRPGPGLGSGDGPRSASRGLAGGGGGASHTPRSSAVTSVGSLDTRGNDECALLLTHEVCTFNQIVINDNYIRQQTTDEKEL